MDALTEAEIRTSFVNCSKGEAGRIRLPLDFAATPWANLDFLGWTDPGAPQRALIVLPGPDGPRGVLLRKPEPRRAGSGMVKSSMCRVCLTEHSAGGVTLFVAPLAGPAGRKGDTVGDYFCSDLACPLYLRGKLRPRGRLVKHEETLTLDEKIDRALTTLTGFVERISSGR
jgi:FBP C-terminal treble-clef zinc-finger